MTSERIRELQELLEDEPDDGLLNLTLGQEFLSAGDPASALPHLEKVVALEPRYTVAYRYLGAALEQLGRRDDALRAWERGVVIADETGDIQAGKEMSVFLSRLRAGL